MLSEGLEVLGLGRSESYSVVWNSTERDHDTPNVLRRCSSGICIRTLQRPVHLCQEAESAIPSAWLLSSTHVRDHQMT